MTDNIHFRLADRPEDFARLGLAPIRVEPFEDGQRISTDEGNLEWWYFDAHLEDGTAMVVVFYARSPFEPRGPFFPSISINIDLPDGRSITKVYKGKAEEFSAAIDRCDVRIGNNRFSGDLQHYRIVAEIEDVAIDIELKRTVPSFRQTTSHSYFGHGKRERLFAWLAAVPQGEVVAKCRIGTEAFGGAGVGYHDHNWGNAPMWELMNDWYWARAQIGPYTAIVSYVTAAKRYSYEDQINFMLARDGVVVARDRKKVSFATADVAIDPETGKHVANSLSFSHLDGDVRYDLSFVREQTILRAKMTEQLTPLKRFAAWLVGFDGAYHRFVGTARIEKFEGGVSLEKFGDRAMWELMYFGKTRPPAR